MNEQVDSFGRSGGSTATGAPQAPADIGKPAGPAGAENRDPMQPYRELVAGKLDALAVGIQAVAARWQGDDTAHLARQAADMAGSLERLSEGVREKSIEQLVDEARRAADRLRENPLALGAVGLAVGALLGAALPAAAPESRLTDAALDKPGRGSRQAAHPGGANVEGRDVGRDPAAPDAIARH